MSNVAEVVKDRKASIREGERDLSKNMQIGTRLDPIDFGLVDFLAAQLRLTRSRCASMLIEAGVHDALGSLGYHLGFDNGIPALYDANTGEVVEHIAPPGLHPDEEDAA